MSTITIEFDLELSPHEDFDMMEYVKEKLEQTDFKQETAEGFDKAYAMLNRASMMQQLMGIGVACIEPDDGFEDHATVTYLEHYCELGCQVLLIEGHTVYVICD